MQLRFSGLGILYLVATPIGNLEDISTRSLRILKEARLVAAEDTRQTRKLLAHFDIHTPLTSYHEHNKLARLDQLLQVLSEGDIALVSDAGTPGLNDPGYELVQAVLRAGYNVSPVPGPSAPIAALVASGLPTDAFLYLGYLPRRSAERRRALEEIAGLPYTLIFLETPHRLLEALRDIQAVLDDRPIAVARELTKLHEEIFRGSVGGAIDYFTNQPPRGEFVLVIGARLNGDQLWTESRLETAVQSRLAAGEPPAQAAADLAQESGWPRREIYRRLVAGLERPD